LICFDQFIWSDSGSNCAGKLFSRFWERFALAVAALEKQGFDFHPLDRLS
jgi:hypothetical protein